MSVVLVTGGAGFVGAHITNDLIEKGDTVVVLDDLSGGFLDNINEKAIFIKGSVVDDALVSTLFEKYKFDYVFHLAAYAAEGLSHFIKRFNYMNNLIGSINLINESIKHNIKCFVFTSSIAVYGSAKPPMKEDTTIPEPEDSYGISKLAVEKELKISHELFGLNYIIFRAHNIYGEYQNIGDMYRNVVGIFMTQLMKKKPLTIFGDGTQTRAFSYIRDISPIMAASIHNTQLHNQIFNIGGDKEYSVNELAGKVMEAMKLNGEILHLPERYEVKNAFADHSKLSQFGITKKSTSLEQGLLEMARWAKLVGIRTSKKFDNIEITKNLPPSWV